MVTKPTLFKSKIIAACIVMLQTFIPAYAENTPAPSLYKKIANHYIKPSELEEINTLNAPKKDSEKNFFLGIIPQPKLEIVSLTKGQQKSILCNTILSSPYSATTLESHAWDDMQFFKHANFLELISTNRTRTTVGELVLGKMLVEPIIDVNKLLNRQAILNELMENKKLFKTIDAQLQRIQNSQDIFLSLWQEEPEMTNQFINQINPYSVYYKSKSTSTNEFLIRFVQSVIGLEFGGLAGLTYFAYFTHPTSDSLQKLQAQWRIYSPIIWLLQLVTLQQLKVVYIDTAHYIQTKLIHVASVINAAKNLHTIINNNALLKKEVVGFDSIHQLLTKTVHASADLKELLINLETDTFKDKASFFSVTGRIIATYNLLNDVKKEFGNLLEAVGSVDAYMTMARLVKESESNNVHYCFAQFEDASKPHIALTDFWNPLLQPEQAIPNSIELGGDIHRNMILTGQNTAGKSTVLMAITYCLTLAQTFGIAPAQTMSFTPFKIMNTYVNVTDNIAEGRSLFANEVHRAKGLMQRVEELHPYEFSFTIIDEMFRGTGPEHAEALSYSYAKKLAQFPNAIVIESTHYPKLINLEEETKGEYQNYKMDILQLENGTLHRPYKMDQGYTLVNIAQEILKEQGLLLE